MLILKGNEALTYWKKRDSEYRKRDYKNYHFILASENEQDQLLLGTFDHRQGNSDRYREWLDNTFGDNSEVVDRWTRSLCGSTLIDVHKAYDYIVVYKDIQLTNALAEKFEQEFINTMPCVRLPGESDFITIGEYMNQTNKPAQLSLFEVDTE